MKPLFGLMIAGVFALGAATSASALTYAQASLTPSGRQLVNSDAAMDSMASSLRDGSVQGGQAQSSVLAFGGGDSDASQAGGETETRAVRRRRLPAGFREAPALNAADLYDQEPPFMPIVVGDTPTH